MSNILRPIAVFATLLGAGSFIAAAQDAPKRFTARELFYNAGEDQAGKPAAKPAQKPVASVPATTKRPPAATATQVAVANKPSAVTPDPAVKPSTNLKPSTSVTATRVETAIATSPDGSPIIRATKTATAPAPTNGPALGLKITVLKRTGREDVEVAPNTEFHAGDKIRFSVQTNGPGYLYIVNQGSSGTWKPVFPSPEIADGDNHVDGWHAYTMPPKSALVFDEQTGTEKIFIVFTRDPEPEFENMIYSLPGAKGQQATPSSPVNQPESAPKRQKELLVSAKLNVPDSAIDKFRRTYSRDLIIEKVDESTPTAPGEKKEKAVYVVNPTGSSDPRVVADLQLTHQ